MLNYVHFQGGLTWIHLSKVPSNWLSQGYPLDVAVVLAVFAANAYPDDDGWYLKAVVAYLHRV